jgi:hypothetical protein
MKLEASQPQHYGWITDLTSDEPEHRAIVRMDPPFAIKWYAHGDGVKGLHAVLPARDCRGEYGIERTRWRHHASTLFDAPSSRFAFLPHWRVHRILSLLLPNVCMLGV